MTASPFARWIDPAKVFVPSWPEGGVLVARMDQTKSVVPAALVDMIPLQIVEMNISET
jgi:hypothetical protein